MPNILADKILTMYDIDTNLDTLHEGKIADGIKKIGKAIVMGTSITDDWRIFPAQQAAVSRATQDHATEVRKKADKYSGATERAEQTKRAEQGDLERLELTRRNMIDKTKELDKAKSISKSSAGIHGASLAFLAAKKKNSLAKAIKKTGVSPNIVQNKQENNNLKKGIGGQNA